MEAATRRRESRGRSGGNKHAQHITVRLMRRRHRSGGLAGRSIAREAIRGRGHIVRGGGGLRYLCAYARHEVEDESLLGHRSRTAPSVRLASLIRAAE